MEIKRLKHLLLSRELGSDKVNIYSFNANYSPHVISLLMHPLRKPTNWRTRQKDTVWIRYEASSSCLSLKTHQKESIYKGYNPELSSHLRIRAVSGTVKSIIMSKRKLRYYLESDTEKNLPPPHKYVCAGEHKPLFSRL